MKPTLALYSYGDVPPRVLHNIMSAFAEDNDWFLRLPDGTGGIYSTRCKVATKFMATDSDVLVEMDRDITCNADDRRYMVKLARERRGVVGCAIARKAKGKGLASRLPPGEYSPGSDQIIELPPGYWTGAGLIATHRDVFEAIGATMKMTRQGYVPYYRPFEIDLGDGIPFDLSEDWAMVERARQDLGFFAHLLKDAVE